MAELDFLPDAPAGETGEETTAERPDLSFIPDADAAHDRVQQNLNLSADMDPDAEARRQQLAETSGMPLPLVREQEKAVRKQYEAPDIGRMAIDAPRTLEFFGSLENAAVARDDHENLTRVEKAWEQYKKYTRPRNIIRYIRDVAGKAATDYKSGKQNIELGNLYAGKLSNTLMGVEDRLLEDRIHAVETRRIEPAVDENILESVVTATAQMAPIMVETLVQGQATGLQYATVGAVGSAALSFGPQALLSPAYIPTAAGVMYGAGVKVGAAGAMFRLEGGLAFEEISKLTDDNGQPIDPRIAAVAAVATGGINAGLEFVGLKYIPGGEKLLGNITRKAAGEALKNPSVRRALLGVAKKYAGGITAESMTEMAQEGMTILASWAARRTSQAVEGTSFDFSSDEILPRILESGKEAFFASLGMGLPGTVVNAVTETGRVQQAQRYDESLKKIKETVDAGKLRKRSPEAAKRHLDMVGAGEDVFISAEYFQQDPEKAARVFEQLGLDPEVARHRAEIGQDVAVPLSDLVARLETEDFAEIARDAKPAPGAMTAREVAALDIKQEVERVAERFARAKEEIAPANAELTRIREQARAAGYTVQYTRDYTDALLTRFADAMGYNPKERAELFSWIHIRGGRTVPGVFTAGQVYNQAGRIETEVKAFKDWFKKSKVVDEQKKPLVVYHGTRQDFEAFDPESDNRHDSGWLGRGFYFSSKYDIAKHYKTVKQGERGRIIPAYLSLQNPYYATYDEKERLMLEDKKGRGREASEKFREDLIAQGYDGVVLTYDYDKSVKEFVAFQPEQIKSTINQGTWSPTDPNIYHQLAKLPDPVMAQGLMQDESGQTVFNIEQAARAVAEQEKTFYQGVETPVGGRFMRGAGSKTGPLAQDVVADAITDDILDEYDQVTSVDEARQWAEQSEYLDPVVLADKQKTRYRKKKGLFGNKKMIFSSTAYPSGRNTYDYPGCGRMAWADKNALDMLSACYGGACYAEVFAKIYKKSIAEGIDVQPLRVKSMREKIEKYYKRNGLEKTQERFPAFVINEKDEGLSIAIVKQYLSGARVSKNLTRADGVDIRLGVDTDGAAWLADPEVMDALLAANPRSLSVFSSAYHAPPPPHALSGRTIINVTVSGWHPLPETLHRLKWAEEARANGWNVILREVVADGEEFGKETAARYNRLHDALMQTDFFIMQQGLHRGKKTSKPQWGMPTCCNGSRKNPGTCDQCEVNEGLGREFAKYWNIQEEDVREEQILPDVIPARIARYTQAWDPGFPKVAVHTTSTVMTKTHKALHEKAKAGDLKAANEIVRNVIKPDRIKALAAAHPNAVVVPVIAEEQTGENKLPLSYANAIKDIGGLEYTTDIIQANVAGHTGKTAFHRLFTPADFVGHVIPGQEYILSDDVITSGGTLNDLRLYIESKGGKVVNVTALGFSKGSTVIAAKPETLAELERKHDRKELENILAEYGAPGDINSLTESQARYLATFASLDRFRNRIAKEKIRRRDEGQRGLFQRPGLSPTDQTYFQFDVTPPLFQDEDTPTPRGSLRITDEKYLISLFEGANLSTLLHETGHLFLNEIQSLVESGRATEQTQKDYRTIRNWVGLKEGRAFEREHHEQFARGFEAYLMEGKAPTADLAGAFQRFKQWLRAVYGSVKELNVTLTDEVRGVFDRMLTDRQQIETAAALNEMVMPAKSQMDAMGIVAEDRSYMERLLKQAYEAAEMEMVRDRDRNRRKNTAAWRKQVRAEADNDPIYALIADLRKGGGINRGMLIDEYGLKTVAALPPGVAKAGGQAPEVVAAGLPATGISMEPLFPSADEMVRVLAATPSKADAVKQRMDQLAAEHDARYRAEDYLVSTDQYGAFLEIMAKYENRDARGITPRKAFALHAQRELDQMPVRDAVRHDRFLASMKKYSRIETDKARQQKFDEAAEANELVRLNYEMAGQAVKNRREVEKTIRKLRDAAKSSTIAYPYHDNLLALAQRFGLGTPAMVPKDPAGKPALTDLLSDENELIDNSGAFSDFLTNESFTLDYRRLTMAQMTELSDLINFLIGRGRDAKKAMLSDKSMSIEAAAMEIAAETRTLPAKKIRRKASFLRKTTDAARGYFAMLDSLQFIAMALGGYRNIGKKGVKSRAEQLLVDPIFAAQDKETVMFGEVYQKMLPHMRAVQRAMRRLHKWYGRRIRLDGAEVPYLLQQDGQDGWWSADQIFAIALNMGNEGNIERLYNGYPDLSSTTVDQLLGLLEKEDWDAVQGIWDVIDSLYEDLNRVHKNINYFPMDKVDAIPVATRFGEYRGGYYPARFDPSLVSAESLKVAGWAETDDLLSRSEAIRQVPVSKSGMTKKRVTGVRLPLRLTMSVADEHIRDAVHYITHAEVVRDVDRITRHHLIVEQTQRALGQKVYDMIRPALKYIARPERDYQSDMDRRIEWFRGRTTPFILALNTSVAFKQVFSSPAAAFDMGLKDYLHGFTILFTSSPMRRYHEMQELSPYMAARAKSFDRELMQMFQRMKPDQRALWFGDKAVAWEDVRNFGFWPIRLMDTVAVVPIWHGAFQKSMRETGGNAEASVAYADNIVRKTQPSAQPVDLTQWQRVGGIPRLFSLFQTFTVGKYRQRQRLHYRAWRAGKMSTADYAWFNFMDAVLPAVGMQMLFAVLWGRDLKDEESWWEMAKGVLQYWLLTGLPIFEGLWGEFGGPLDTPVSAGPDEFKKAIRNGVDYIADQDEDNTEKVVWSIAHIISYILGVPVSKIAAKAAKGAGQEGGPQKYVIPAPRK